MVGRWIQRRVILERRGMHYGMAVDGMHYDLRGFWYDVSDSGLIFAGSWRLLLDMHLI